MGHGPFFQRDFHRHNNRHYKKKHIRLTFWELTGIHTHSSKNTKFLHQKCRWRHLIIWNPGPSQFRLKDEEVNLFIFVHKQPVNSSLVLWGSTYCQTMGPEPSFPLLLKRLPNQMPLRLHTWQLLSIRLTLYSMYWKYLWALLYCANVGVGEYRYIKNHLKMQSPHLKARGAGSGVPAAKWSAEF
jgi:hypothetical protein